MERHIRFWGLRIREGMSECHDHPKQRVIRQVCWSSYHMLELHHLLLYYFVILLSIDRRVLTLSYTGGIKYV